jgi:hypothetical protein
MEWVRRKWKWAKQNPLFWANIFLALLCYVVVFEWPAPGQSDFRVRILGLVLQIVGVVTVWHNLTKNARQFGKGDLTRRTWIWLKAGFIGRRAVIGAVTAEAAAAAMSARAKVRRPINSDAPLPDRVANLEQNFAQLDDDLDSAYREIDRQAAQLRTEVKTEIAERKQADNALKCEIAEVAAGNYTILLFGVVWLCVGLLLASLAPEIVKTFSGHG